MQSNPTEPQTQTEPHVRNLAWNPTSDQLRAYAKREVEMCVEAIRRNIDRQTNTLFSSRTWELAQKVMQSATQDTTTRS